MPRFSDIIATMPTEELRKQIESMKQEYNELDEQSRRVWDEWRENKITDGEMIYKKIANKRDQLIGKIFRAQRERHRRDIQETL